MRCTFLLSLVEFFNCLETYRRLFSKSVKYANRELSPIPLVNISPIPPVHGVSSSNNNKRLDCKTGGIIVQIREPAENKLLVSQLWDTERLIIRDANLQDVDRLQEIYTQSRSTEGWTRADEMTDDYILKAVIEGHLPPDGKKECFSIQLISLKDSSEIIGLIEFYKGYPDKGVLYIGTLLFSEEYRNKGYGQEIVSKLFTDAIELGFLQVRLGVALKNWQGIYFWTKLGFNRIIKFSGDKVFAKDTFAILELGKIL